MKKINTQRYQPLFLPALKGATGYFVLSAFEVVFDIVALYLSLFVTSYVLDYVLKGEQPAIPAFLFNWLESLGPVAKSYWLCGLAFLLFTALPWTTAATASI